MYVLIILIHTVFLSIAYLLDYTLLQGIFLILGIFFLFYFSPFFFLNEDKVQKKTTTPFSFREIFLSLSPKESLILPVILLYIAIYGFFFSLFGDSNNILLLHFILISSIYCIFGAYGLFFYWKHDVFFELFRLHTLFTLLSIVFITIVFIFQKIEYSILFSFISLIGSIASIFLLWYTKKENSLFLGSFIFSIYGNIYFFLIFLFPTIEIIPLLSVLTLVSVGIFEIFPKIPLFQPFTSFFQYSTLFIILLSLPFTVFFTINTLQASLITLLLFIVGFFLSIHTRYMNYVVFLISILLIYCIYGLIFSDLIVRPSITSLFLFIFFLPSLVIGTSYFWEEKHEYDFSILHFTSISFSVIYSFYIIFFLPWGGNLLFIISLCIFGLALLFFLSFFRFRLNKTIS